MLLRAEESLGASLSSVKLKQDTEHHGRNLASTCESLFKVNTRQCGFSIASNITDLVGDIFKIPTGTVTFNSRSQIPDTVLPVSVWVT